MYDVFVSDMLEYGCTRLEIGVQSVYEDVARDTNRCWFATRALTGAGLLLEALTGARSFVTRALTGAGLLLEALTGARLLPGTLWQRVLFCC